MIFGFRFKVILFSCALVLITNAAIIYLFQMEVDESKRQAQRERLPTESAKVLNDIKAVLDITYFDLLRWAKHNDTPTLRGNTVNRNPTLIKNRKLLIASLKTRLNEQNHITSLSFIDMYDLGQETFRINRDDANELSAQSSKKINTRLKDPAFTNAVTLDEGEIAITISSENRSIGDDKNTATKQVLLFSTPVFNKQGAVIGVLIASLDLPSIIEKAFNNNHKDILVSLDSRFNEIHTTTRLTDLPLEKISMIFNNPTYVETITALSETKLTKSLRSVVSEKSYPFKNLDFIVDHLRVPLSPTIAHSVSGKAPPIELYLLTPHQIKSFDLPDADLRLGLTYISILLVTYLLALAFSRSLTRPLNQIVEATKLFTDQGYIFEGKLPLKAKDETGKIARAFVALFDQVQNNYTDLDDTIRELVVSQASQVKRHMQLKETSEKDKSATRIKYEFLSKISREIRTPLNGIIGSLQLLEDSEVNDRQHNLVGDAKSSSRYLLKLLNDLIDASNLEKHELQVAKDPFLIRDLINEIPPIIASIKEEHQAKLTIDIPSDFNPTLIGDHARLQQILVNILSFCFKHCEANSDITLSMQILEEENNRAQIKFIVKNPSNQEDTTDLDLLGKLLENEETAPEDMPCEVGFSLGNSKKILELMGSELCLEVTPQIGSILSFVVEFPKIDLIEAETITQDYFDGLSTLVVDNVPVNRNVLSKILRNFGAKVTTAADGVEAVNLCDESHFDIIYMDIQMPVMDGESATKVIRKNSSKNHSSLIIAVTAHERSEDQERFKEIMDGCLIKPLKKNQLIRETYLALKRTGKI